MDFLGLRNLAVIETALELIETATGDEVDIDNVPLDDEPTLEMLRRATRSASSSSRAGPMRRPDALARADELRRRRRARRALPPRADGGEHAQRLRRPQERSAGVTYLHPDLEPILGDTYGLMIYQESVMRVAQKFAGYSLTRPTTCARPAGRRSRDDRRRAREVRRRLRRDRLRGRARHALFRHHRALRRLRLQQVPRLRLRLHRVPDRLAEGELPGRVPGRAAHLGEGRQGQERDLPRRVPDAGIEVLVPDVNASGSSSPRRTTRDRAPRPRGSSSGCPRSATSARGSSALIVPSATKSGPFADFYDFCCRVDPTVLNKRTIESLIKAGAFDSLGHPRKGLCRSSSMSSTTSSPGGVSGQGLSTLFSRSRGPDGGRAVRRGASRDPRSSSKSPNGSRWKRRCSAST